MLYALLKIPVVTLGGVQQGTGNKSSAKILILQVILYYINPMLHVLTIKS